MNQFEVLRRQSKEIDGTSITIFTNLHDLNEVKKAVNKYKKINVVALINGIEERFQYINPEVQWSDIWGNLYGLKEMADSNEQVNWKIVSKDTAITMNQRLLMPIFYQQQDMPFELQSIQEPEHLTYRSVPKSRRRKWQNKDETPYSFQSYLDLIKKLEKHDKTFNTDWREQFPELC